jgi:hypothetical protein
MSFLPTPETTAGAFAMGVCGRRGSGKSYFVVDLLKYFYRGIFDLIIWISPTFLLQDICTTGLGDCTGLIIIPEWKPEIIQVLFAYMFQRNVNAEKEGRQKERALLILDDVGALGKKGKLSEQLDNVAFVSRNYGVSVIEVVQRITLLSTGMRSQLDCLLIFKEQNPQERINLFRSLGFCEKKEFHETIERHTDEKYSWIGLKNESGRLFFFNLNGKIVPLRTNRIQPGIGSPSDSRIQSL